METLELHGAKLRYHKIGKGPTYFNSWCKWNW